MAEGLSSIGIRARRLLRRAPISTPRRKQA